MAISGHRTERVYKRYDIVSAKDNSDAAAKLEASTPTTDGHNRPDHRAQQILQ
jgi:hypothetical protein